MRGQQSITAQLARFNAGITLALLNILIIF